MPKNYLQRFRVEWKREDIFKKWLTAVPGDDSKAYCRYCRKHLDAKRSTLARHVHCTKHKSGIPSVPKTPAIYLTASTEEKDDVSKLEEGPTIMEQNGVSQAVAAILKLEESSATEYQVAQEEEGDQVAQENSGDENDTTSQSPYNGKKKESSVSGAAGVQFDTTNAFNEVFGDRRAFDSWDEYTDLLEEFQTRSGTRFKPRSSCRVEQVNDNRVGTPIPERFVYKSVKMICVHYGEAGSDKKKDYVGKGCQAFMQVSYSKGTLWVKQNHLVHTNHDRSFEKDNPHTRNFRVVKFTEDLDNLLITEVLRANPLQFTKGEKEWTQAVDRLKVSDPNFSHLTSRVIKKRTRLLLDNFSAISHGRKPPEEDKMGCMLFQLLQSKDHKTRKKKKPGRPCRVSMSEKQTDLGENEDDDDFLAYTPAKKARVKNTTSLSSDGLASMSEEEMDHVEDEDDEDVVVYSPANKPKVKKTSTSSRVTPSSSLRKSAASGFGGDIAKLLSFLQKKDQEDRRLQQKERGEDRRLQRKERAEDRRQRLKDAEEDRKLRQSEIDLRREELAFQKERFELEKTERQVHMDLLKSQLQVFEQSMLAQPLRSQPQPALQQPPPAQQPQPTHQYHYQT